MKKVKHYGKRYLSVNVGVEGTDGYRMGVNTVMTSVGTSHVCGCAFHWSTCICPLSVLSALW